MRKDEIKVGDVLALYGGPHPRELSVLEAAATYGARKATVLAEPRNDRRQGWVVSVSAERHDGSALELDVPTRELVGWWSAYEVLAAEVRSTERARQERETTERAALSARWAVLTPKLEAKGVRLVIPPHYTATLSIEQLERLVS